MCLCDVCRVELTMCVCDVCRVELTVCVCVMFVGWS